MSRIHRFAIALALLAAVHAQAVVAQRQVDSQIVPVLRSVNPGEEIQLRTRDGALLSGSVVRLTDSTVSVNAENRLAVLPIANLETVWTRSSKVAEGAKKGAIIGSVLGAALGVLFVAGLCEQSSCASDYFVAAPVGAFIVALPATLLGAAIGQSVRSWKRRYPS